MAKLTSSIDVVESYLKPESVVVNAGKVVHVVVDTPSLVVDRVESGSRHGKYADEEARKAYQREWVKRKRKGGM